MCFFDPKIWIFGAKSHFFDSDRDFCQWSKRPLYSGLQLSHWNHPKKNSVSELGVIFWGSPLFLAVFGHSHVRRATTLSFGPISTKLGGIIRAIKKNDPEGQRTRSGPESRRNGRFYVRPKSGFWPKNGSYPKKSPKMTFPPLIIWAKGPFFFEQLFPVVARTWLELKSECLFFWSQNFGFLVPKIRFFVHTTPIFG